MRTLLNIFCATVLVGTLFGFSRPAAAQTVSVQVRSIAASTHGKHFDGRLNDLRGKLKMAFAGYTNFQLVNNASFTVGKKQTHAVTLPNGSTMKVTFFGMMRQFIKLGLGIDGKLNTTLRVTSGSTFFQAGLSYKGGILVIAITVR